MPYARLPEELGFVKPVQGQALQRLHAEKRVIVEKAIGRTSTKSSRWLNPKRRKEAKHLLKFALQLKLRNLTRNTQDIVLPRGSFWHCSREWHQPLLNIREMRLTLKPRAKMTLELDCLGGASVYYCPDGVPMELSAYQLLPKGESADALRGQYDLWRHLKPSVVVPIPSTARKPDTGAGPIAATITERDRSFEEMCAETDRKAREASANDWGRAELEQRALASSRSVVEEAERQRAKEVQLQRVATRKQWEAERKAQDARAMEAYAVVEVGVGRAVDGAAGETGLPDWFEQLAPSAKLAAIRENQLGDWAAFNAWLRTEYDADELADFAFDDEEDLQIHTKFYAVRAAERQKQRLARQQHDQQAAAARRSEKKSWLEWDA